MGRRNSKDSYGDITQYLHDGGNIIAEYDAQLNLLHKIIYTPGIDQPIAFIRGNDKYFYHTDELGSVVGLSDASGTLVEQYQYGPFGANNEVSQLGNPLRYTARRFDEDSGLYYYRARYYSTELGRFLQPDPLGYADGLNIYAYVGNDPLNFVDPSGMYGQGLDNLQTGLDVGGLTPGLGIFPDAANVIISLGRGNFGDALISGGAMIPIFGQGVTGVKLGKKATEGIYEFTDTAGKLYVGQSNNIAKRLNQHVNSGKLHKNQNVKTTQVLGGKTTREIAEHRRIQEITGGVAARRSNKVSNKVDPIGPKRRHLLEP